MNNKQEQKQEEVREDNIYMSLCKMQFALPTIEKKRNGYNFKYADLSDIWEAIRKPLRDNGFSLIQLVQSEEGKNYIITKLFHMSGEVIESKTLIEFTAKKFQDVGTALTYYRRYALSAMLGIVSDEDVDDSKSKKDDIYKDVSQQTISKQQIIAIENLINGHQDIRIEMIKHYKSLDKILADNYENVINIINKLIKDKEGKK